MHTGFQPATGPATAGGESEQVVPPAVGQGAARDKDCRHYIIRQISEPPIDALRPETLQREQSLTA